MALDKDTVVMMHMVVVEIQVDLRGAQEKIVDKLIQHKQLNLDLNQEELKKIENKELRI